jgi:hypothetical protein
LLNFHFLYVNMKVSYERSLEVYWVLEQDHWKSSLGFETRSLEVRWKRSLEIRWVLEHFFTGSSLGFFVREQLPCWDKHWSKNIYE